MRIALVALVLIVAAGCSSEPDGDANLLEHTHFAHHGKFDVLGYAKAVCSDLRKGHATTPEDLNVEILSLSNNGWTVADAIREANAAVTYVCPKFAGLKH